MRRSAHGLVLMALMAPLTAAAAGESFVADVRTGPDFFNPAIGQRAFVEFSLREAGAVGFTILDRDLVPIRTFPLTHRNTGPVRIEWDGRDDTGVLVPDEAYSIRITCACAGGPASYTPAEGFQPAMSEPARTYTPVSGVLRYELAAASRVHIEAGRVERGRDGTLGGPVMKTVVDREPRAAGTVAEHYDGYDESGTIFIPALSGAATSIMTETLPPHTFITVGNRSETFRSYVRNRRAAKPVIFPDATNHHHGTLGAHHQGLSSLEDFSPPLTLQLVGTRDSRGRTHLGDKVIKARVGMDPEDAKHFIRPEALLMVFIDAHEVFRKQGLSAPYDLVVDAAGLTAGEHVVTVNWVSRHGPVAVQVARVVAGKERATKTGAR